MKLVKVVCPACGASVEVDEYSRSFQCTHCGVSTVIEKDSYNTNYNDDRLQKAEILIREHKNYKDAKSYFENGIHSDPRDPRPWLGLVRCLTCDFTEKLYIETANNPPVWLERAEENLLYYYSKYEQLESKKETLGSIKQYFDDYVQKNRDEYKEILEKYQNSNDTSIATYDSTIKAANKIISNEDLKLLFEEMHKTLESLMELSDAEKKRDTKFDFDDLECTCEDSGSEMTFKIDFTDSTESKLDNYDEFMNVFETRLKEIKEIYVYYHLYYWYKKPKTQTKEKINDIHSQTIRLYISQNKFEIETNLLSDDRKLDKIYNLIRKIVNESPVKYDKLIKKRGMLQLFIGISYSLIPAILLSVLVLISESLRETVFEYIYLFPAMCFGLSLVLSGLVFIGLTNMYKTIIPEQKYVGYRDHKSVYTDDVDDFIKKSEVIIGKNYKNLEIRKSLNKMIDTGKKLIFPELIAIAIITIILFVISQNV